MSSPFSSSSSGSGSGVDAGFVKGDTVTAPPQTATPSPTPTPSASTTSALGDDASSPSASATAALSTLATCMQSIVIADVPYAQCVMNSGLFALNETQPANLRRRLRDPKTTEGALLSYLRLQLSSEELQQSSIGQCRLQCTAPSFHASTSCCDATAQLRACALSESAQTPDLLACKQSLDDSFAFSNQECSALSREDVGLVSVFSVVALIIAAFAGSYFLKRRKAKETETETETDQKENLTEVDSPVAAWLRQIGILVWKNLVLRLRRPVNLVVEQLVPLLFVCALVVLANLDNIFGRNRNSLYRTSDEAASQSNKLLCVGITSIEATDLGAPSGTMRSFYASGQSVLGLFFLLSFIKFVSSMTAAMVHEKEIKMREMMKIMGVSNGALLVSWSVTNTLLSLPVVFVLSAMLKFGNVFPTTPFATVVFVFWSLSVATVAFAYALTPWFRKSRTAAIFSVLVWVLLFFPFFVVQPKTTSGPKYGGALAPPTAFALAIDRLLREAQLGTGFAYSMTAAVSTTAFVGVPSATAMSWFLLLDSVILLALGWYFEQVLPQQFGVRKPWYFLFQRDHWQPHNAKFKQSLARQTNVVESPSLYALGSPRTNNGGGGGGYYIGAATPRPTPVVLNISDVSNAPAAVVEPVSAELVMQEHNGASLQLRGLTKLFTLQDGEEKLAVDNLTLTFYSGQITSLLGHNGAGKTTTISMLTGLYPPTSGDALLFGRSLQHESDAFRRIMGVCPQHDVLFPDLTVEEHLKFFSTIKRVRGSRAYIEETLTSLLTDVGLTGSRRVLAKNLSGGQKRKLSVALALLGDSKLVFFDEPTSGMDPYSRRFTWNMLRKQRENRVIVLTTHFMDEADVLGDRIAILADGRLRCVGSSLFLKTRYGAGYNLTMIKDKDRVFDISAMMGLLHTHLGHSEAKLASDSGSEVVFTLPTHAATQFPSLFDVLDTEMATLGIRNYGISVTTLEDVFLRIAHDRDDDNHDEMLLSNTKQRLPSASAVASPVLSPPPFSDQFKTLLLKRWWISKRDKKSLLNAIGIPLLFLVIMAALPEIQVASFLPDYATSFATPAQQEACPVVNITANALDATTYTRCMVQGYGFCSLGIVDCDADACCNAANFQSPFYACSTCPQTAAQLASNTTTPCYSGKCMRRNGAKLQVALNAFIIAMIVMLAFAFVPAALIAFIVREKDPNQDAKALQWISGMSLDAYWASNFAHDLAVIAWPVLVALITTPISHRALGGTEEVLALVLLIITHALSVVPMTYLYSRRFTKHANAQTSMLVFALSSGGLLSIFSFLCRVVDFSMSSSLTLSGLDRDYLRWIFMLFPGYALNNGIYEIATRKITRGSLYGSRWNANPQSSLFGLFVGFGKNPRCQACWNRNIPGCCVRGVLDFDVALAPIIYMLLEAGAFTALLYVYEKRRGAQGQEQGKSSKMKTKPSIEKMEEEEDDDVAAERVRLDQPIIFSNEAITMRHLHHEYADGRVALQDLSLAIPKGECFGYLGVNGAGKSTTIKVLTRQVVPSSGSVEVSGRSLTDPASESTAQLIGYCPQFDALHDLLTVEEELTLYARLKGIAADRVVLEVDEKIHQLGLHEYRAKLTRGLSGGNKRKVSTAIALLGAPPIVILDEPSTGMDPSSRRKMWNVIASTCATYQTSVLLTTHSMEECEALCSRVGILVQGQLKCLGSVQHLRHKFGRGYTVDVKLQSEPTKREVDTLMRQARDILNEQGGLQQVSETQVVQLSEALDNLERGLQLTLKGSHASGAHSDWWNLVAADGVNRAMSLDQFCVWWLARDKNDALLSFLPTRFPGTKLVEQHGDHFRFHVPKTLQSEMGSVRSGGDAHVLRPKEIFAVLEDSKLQLSIQEYSVSDTSLEHIFNRMADENDRAGSEIESEDGTRSHTSEADE